MARGRHDESRRGRSMAGVPRGQSRTGRAAETSRQGQGTAPGWKTLFLESDRTAGGNAGTGGPPDFDARAEQGKFGRPAERLRARRGEDVRARYSLRAVEKHASARGRKKLAAGTG